MATLTLAQAGGILSIGSTLTGMVGAYAAANAERYKYQSQGLNLEHQQDMASINARMLEMQAQQWH